MQHGNKSGVKTDRCLNEIWNITLMCHHRSALKGFLKNLSSVWWHYLTHTHTHTRMDMGMIKINYDKWKMEQSGRLIWRIDRLSIAFRSASHWLTQSAFKGGKRPLTQSSLLSGRNHHGNSSFFSILSPFYLSWYKSVGEHFCQHYFVISSMVQAILIRPTASNQVL